MDNIYTIASSSASTTYGNIMTFFKEYLTQNFSANFFKDITVTSEISYVNIRKRLGRNTLNEMAKLERPFMTIEPQIQPPNSDLYLFDIPLTKNFDNMEYGFQKNTLFPIIKNTQDEYKLMYKLNRDQIQFEVRITVDTLIQQLDLYKYMLNHFVWDRPFTQKTSLESMIPREIINHIGFLSNIDLLNTKVNAVPFILQYMNRWSNYPITYKMRNGTSLDEFFMYYTANLMITLNDLSTDQVNRKGMTDDFYQITFRGVIDFNLPGVYVLLGNKPKPDELKVTLESIGKNGTTDLVPLFTINNFYSRYESTRNGYMLYTSSRFQTERNPSTHKDSLCIDILFEDSYIEVINRFNANNIPIKTLLDLILVKDGVELIQDTDWSFNAKKMELTINEADDDATYCILIYINNNLFTENITNLIEDTKTDKPKL